MSSTATKPAPATDDLLSSFSRWWANYPKRDGEPVVTMLMSAYHAGRADERAAITGGGNLTPQQRRVLDFVVDYRRECGMSPLLTEIADALGASKVTAFEHVRALERKGFIRTARHKSRSIEVVA